MKITRHIAPDMRQALRAVREQLGPDAVILSSRRTAAGVEITAAMDFDEAEIRAAEALARSANANRSKDVNGPSFADTLGAQATPGSQALPHAAGAPASPAHAATTNAHAPTRQALPAEDDFNEVFAGAAITPPAEGPTPAGTAPCATDLMSHELKTLRRMLETQLAQLAWNDLSRRAPIHTEMLRELTEIGLGHELAAQVVSHLPAHADITQARRISIATLSQQVLVTGDRWLEDGGRVALVGPTGVGKTTTLAKLAVRWVLRHGPRDLAIVAADSVRLGAQDQLRTLGQLLGAPVYTTDTLDELPALLSSLAKTRLVLIDTPGSSQRDAMLGERLAALSAVGAEVETALVLAASTQAGAIAETVQRFAAAAPASCVLTKVDEAASLGGVLSVLVKARLPISYMSEGQRVPEDLRPARSLELVSSAVQLAHTTGAAADEDLLRRRFGEAAHALA